MLKYSDLRPYQLRTISFGMQNPACGLFLDMGLGKTVSTLTIVKNLILTGAIRKVLIIAPKRVAINVWKDELEEWEHLQGLTISVAAGKSSVRKRLAALRAPADIYTINRENVAWLVAEFGQNWPFDMVVIDESSSFKSAQSNRFKALRSVRQYFTRCILLTGTPAPNSLEDLWSQLWLIDQGLRLGRTLTEFRNTYFNAIPNGVSMTYEIKRGYIPGVNKTYEDIIADRIADVCISMKTEDYITLPEFLIIDRKIEFSPELRATYKDFERDQVLRLAEGGIITPANAAVLAGKLLQFASGTIYTPEGETIHIHGDKLEVLDEIIEAAETPILLFYQYRADRDRILKRYKFARELDDKPETVKQWNARKIKLLICHPASAGHGLNLQRGGSYMVWFGPNWSLELWQQGIKRLHRSGALDIVRCYRILVPETIEARVIRSNEKKDKTQSGLLDAVKDVAAQYGIKVETKITDAQALAMSLI